MTKASTFLFVSIDGMTDPLGQSQVIPYLLGLTKKGMKIEIISCEKKENWDLHHTTIVSILKKANISWDFCFYKSGKPFLSQLQNYLALKKIVINKVKINSLHTVLHCRSYLPGLIGLYSKKKFNSGFIFDMRGFWSDERIEGGIWNKTNPISSSLYSYFKKKEREMIISSDAIVSLTHKAKEIILSWGLGINTDKINVIPCCVDLEHFSIEKIDSERLSKLQNNYPQLKNQFVLSYVGSLGTWYLAEEMMGFFKSLLNKTNAIFLIITKDSIDLVYEAAKKHNIDFEKLIVVSSSREEMPYYISLSTASVFFIKPSFSKSASSPTKMGELLSTGIPVITNSGIGDVDQIIQETDCGIILNDFNNSSNEMAVKNLIEKIDFYKKNTVATARKYFSLEDGVQKYFKIYTSF